MWHMNRQFRKRNEKTSRERKRAVDGEKGGAEVLACPRGSEIHMALHLLPITTHVYAALEGRVVGGDILEQRQRETIERADGGRSLSGADEDVDSGITVGVGSADADAAGIVRGEGVET